MAEKPGYYAILTADVRYDNDLSSTAKLMYAEISALSNSYGYCSAKNKYFAELYGITVRSVQNALHQMFEKGYIRVEQENRTRKIFITGVKKISWGDEKNFMDKGEKNFTQNNINNNIIYNNNLCSEQNSEPPFITLTLNDKTEYPVTFEYVDEMQQLYQSVDVKTELRKMRAWCINNPKKRKTKSGIKRFINMWLGNEQDKGRRTASPPPQEVPQRYDCVNEGEYDDCIGFTVE